MKQHLPSSRDRAFTLIELMTVMFITAILMTIIVVPMIQSFNTVRAAQAFADAQDKGRELMEKISSEISNSAGVRDNSGDFGACDVVVPDRNGNPIVVRLYNAMIDIVKPAQEGQIDGSGYYIDPNTGKIDPTLRGPKGQILLPVAPGATIARYWIGLRDPFSAAGYNNPYDGLLMPRGGGRDNLFVLFRAEVMPIVNVGGVLQPNIAFFAVSGGKPVLDDPSFFIPDNSDPTVPGTKNFRIKSWLNKATIMTDSARYDMIAPIYDKGTRQVSYDPNTGAPLLLPLIQFRPTRIGNEPAAAKESVVLGAEADGMDQFAPSVFKALHGGWSNTIVRMWPVGWTAGLPYQITRKDNTGDVKIIYFDPSLGGDEMNNGVELFNLSTYENAVSAGGVYSFSAALNAAGLADPAARSQFVPFFPDKKLGKIIAAFGIWEVGGATYAGNNLPNKDCGPEVVPGSNPPVVLPNALETYTTINENFLKVWQDYPDMRPDVHRFIDLRVTPQADGTPSPLDPDPAVGFSRASIVPGSEVVIGPNQLAGGTYGQAVRYSRTKGSPGPNQYRINYVNLPEPTDWSLLGLPNPPAAYDPADFVSAVIQPRYKAGYIQFNSNPALPLPTGNITVQYRFQFTKPGDTLAVDYDTRQVINLLLTIKNFPQTSEPNPQGITLKASATVRNYLR